MNRTVHIPPRWPNKGNGNHSRFRRTVWAFVAVAAVFWGTRAWGQQPEKAEEVLVNFVVKAPDLPSGQTIYLTGSHPSIGNWKPDGVALQSDEDGLWKCRVRLPQNFPLEYKFTLGDWQREAADEQGAKFQNFTTTVRPGMTLRHTVVNWTDGKTRKQHQGQVTGIVKFHRELKGDGLQPRDVVVWLPPGYEESKERFPVLYMHDGQNLFDPGTSAFGVDWQLDETCTRLIESGEIEPLIIVGIYNTPERSKDYAPGDQGRRYAEWLIGTLKPFIDRTYRTWPDRDNTAIGGSSAGGLCAFWVAWEHSDIFGTAFCLSPALQFENKNFESKIDYVTTVRQNPLPDPVPRVFIVNGGKGLESLLQPGVDAMNAALQEKGLQPDHDFFVRVDPEGRHDEATWADRMRDLLRRAYGEQ